MPISQYKTSPAAEIRQKACQLPGNSDPLLSPSHLDGGDKPSLDIIERLVSWRTNDHPSNKGVDRSRSILLRFSSCHPRHFGCTPEGRSAPFVLFFLLFGSFLSERHPFCALEFFCGQPFRCSWSTTDMRYRTSHLWLSD